MQFKKVLIFIVALIVALGLTIDNAESRNGQTYSGLHDVESPCIDSASPGPYTDSTLGANLAPVHYFGNVQYGSISGIMEMYIYSLDTTVCDLTGAATPDTTGDSVRATLYTAWNSQILGNTTGEARSGEAALLTLSFLNPGVGTAKIQRLHFAVPSDSAIGDALYWRFVGHYKNANLTDTIGIVYRTSVSITAR